MFLPSLAGGGAERVFVALANDFAAQGVSVDLALADAAGPYLGEVGPAVRVIDFAAAGVSRAVPKLVRHLRAERPQALLSALDHANIMAVVARAVAGRRIRCVISTRSVPTMLSREAGFLRAAGVLQVARIAYRFADEVIANSAGVAADFSRYFAIRRSRIHVIYNPLSLEGIELASHEPVHAPGFDLAGAPIVLSVGRLSGLKDFPTLLRAFALLRARRECRLVILGEGPDRAALEALAREAGVERDVLLPGFVANPFAWMRRSALFVSSSISEGCPNALLQALACGTPVVSTDAIGGSAEVLEYGKWGRLVPVGDARAMAEAIAATMDSTAPPDVRRRAQDFAHDAIARQYLSVLLPDEFPATSLH
jgi:glycosyltransferase involved in cell wall biosynthesis